MQRIVPDCEKIVLSTEVMPRLITGSRTTSLPWADRAPELIGRFLG